MKAYLTMLEDSECEQIHAATLELLETIGVSVASDDVAAHLASKGAMVIDDLVRFPRKMVEEALEMRDRKILFAAMDDRRSFAIPHKNTTFNATSGFDIYYYPEPGKPRRLSNARDLAKVASLADAVEEIDFFWPTVMPTEETSVPLQEIQALNVSARHTGKHIECSCTTAEAARWEVRLAEALAGGSEELRKRPIISACSWPTSPLGFEKGTAEAFSVLAAAGVPITPMGVPLAGATAPATYAGTLTIANAEVLASLIIAKSYNPDESVIYSTDICSVDIETGDFSYVDPDSDYDLFSVASADMARFYDMPSSVAHGSNERKEIVSLDALMNNVNRQAYNQSTRSDLSVWIGGTDNSLATSIWDIMLDVEALRYAKPYCKEPLVNSRTIALPLIAEVGPHGEFLSCRQTNENYPNEMNVLDPAESYLFEDDGRDYIQKAYEKGLEVLERANPYMLDESITAELDKLMESARRELG